MSLVRSDLVAAASLHRPLDRKLHPYILPYLILWPLAYYIYNHQYDRFLGSEEWTFLMTVTLATTQALIWLSGHWSVDIKARTRYTPAKGIRDAQAIKIVPGPNQGKADICAISNIRHAGEADIETSFIFQKKKFVYDHSKKAFFEIVFPVDKGPKLREFQATRGLSLDDLRTCERLYGFNRFDIPIPSFSELFKEHAVAPFFVFQIFCVALWCLDEYWYYSLFTGFMLVAFESTTVFQRQRTLNEFRTMSITPFPIKAFRGGKWTEVQTDALFPGDLVSIVRTKEDSGLPCDLVLLSGSCIVNEAMLSGESTPLLKESVELRPSDEPLDLAGVDKNAMLSGGTKVLQVTPNEQTRSTAASKIPQPEDKGVLAVVLRTGFETQQGSLVRTMIYSTERVSADNLEALLFILFLLIFAIAASWYVWTQGILQGRKKKKLLLDCILIITSVVPPELPMELSLAVNSSLAALSKFAIFCTEPFRIPFAGQVDVCCFDKTGTLTEENLVVEGVADGGSTSVRSVADVDAATTIVLASAHSVVKLDDGTIVGDPMERATLKAIGWRIGEKETVLPPKKLESGPLVGTTIAIRRRFQFSSALKRQSTVSHISSPGSSQKTLVSVKGAPEMISTMLSSVPSGYAETYKRFTREGSRVISLAYRYLPDNTSQKQINDLDRKELERDLTFAGFLVFSCPLKPDARATIRELNASSHRTVMITGDNPLTAAHVARQVEIVSRDILILDVVDGKLQWQSVDEQVNIPVDPSQPIDPEILTEKDLCVTGYALARFQDAEATTPLRQLIRHAWVYARVSPTQKEFILTELKALGYMTLMCGDGTNDVGALKQAHIGVALLNGSEDDLKKIADHARDSRLKLIYEKQSALMAHWNRPPNPVPQNIAHLFPPGPLNPHRQKSLEAKGKTAEEIKQLDAIALAQAELDAEKKRSLVGGGAQGTANGKPTKQESALQTMLTQMSSEMEDGDDGGPPTIKLGDASCAAPFTSKLSNVSAIARILRQGRCTLVATTQMYKILALNCLISAYSLSVLYLDGIKFGDGQVTISGMLMSVCFYCVSRGRPLDRLSRERPHRGIFNVYIIGSILAQFAVHIATLVYLSHYVQLTEPKELLKTEEDLARKFEPRLMNSAIYLLQLTQQISTFAINYQGRPFRESIRENKFMFWGLVGVGALAFSCSTEFVPEVNEQLKLVKFTGPFKVVLTSLMAADFILCLVIELVFKHLFANDKPSDIALRHKNEPQTILPPPGVDFSFDLDDKKTQ
ncbi:putative cation-transporting ATPase 1 [Savitreella phatthalungensis]